jgi:hypothetical protein
MENNMNTEGGAIYTSNKKSTIDCCIFTQCKATYGGALYLYGIPYIYITHTRFENNSATNGKDIYVYGSGSCFNKNLAGTLAFSVCSTTPTYDRVNCDKDISQLQNTCPEEVV